jgi:protein-S-isoprenylcysteine O-methyltransferase Ste14
MAMILNLDMDSAIGYSWEALAVVWLAGMAFTKRTVRSQSTGTRLFHVALVLLGYSLVCGRWFSVGWLGKRFIPDTHALALIGLTLTVAGCIFAIWARLKLGSNWSGRATVKMGHELVTSGPYALARHPIYTGLIVGVAGSALAYGEWRCILGILVLLVAFMAKMGQEEQLMMQTFPQSYALYRRRVKALIPGVL